MSRSRPDWRGRTGLAYSASAVVSDVAHFMESVLDELVDYRIIREVLDGRPNWTIGHVSMLVRRGWWAYSEEQLLTNFITPDELLREVKPAEFADWLAHHPSLYQWMDDAQAQANSPLVAIAYDELVNVRDQMMDEMKEYIVTAFLPGNEEQLDHLGGRPPVYP